jgi:hypothetical protein
VLLLLLAAAKLWQGRASRRLRAFVQLKHLAGGRSCLAAGNLLRCKAAITRAAGAIIRLWAA